MSNTTVPLRNIKEAITPILEAGEALKAYLFGSYATGTADELSDIDFLIIAESTRPFIERFKDFPGIRRVSPVKSIDMFVYTPAGFERMREAENPFISTVITEGRVIYEAGPGTRRASLATSSRE